MPIETTIRLLWWRTHGMSVRMRGPLKLALLYRRDYVRGARGWAIR